MMIVARCKAHYAVKSLCEPNKRHFAPLLWKISAEWQLKGTVHSGSLQRCYSLVGCLVTPRKELPCGTKACVAQWLQKAYCSFAARTCHTLASKWLLPSGSREKYSLVAVLRHIGPTATEKDAARLLLTGLMVWAIPSAV